MVARTRLIVAVPVLLSVSLCMQTKFLGFMHADERHFLARTEKVWRKNMTNEKSETSGVKKEQRVFFHNCNNNNNINNNNTNNKRVENFELLSF
jgi:hypothetical protein